MYFFKNHFKTVDVWGKTVDVWGKTVDVWGNARSMSCRTVWNNPTEMRLALQLILFEFLGNNLYG